MNPKQTNCCIAVDLLGFFDTIDSTSSLSLSSNLKPFAIRPDAIFISVHTGSNFAFLQNLQEEFTKQHWKSRIKSANAYAMDKSFAPTFRTTMHYYNINQSKLAREEKVTRLMAQVEDMTVVMNRNINLLFQRGGNLEKMLRKSEDMEVDCQVFKKKARSVKKRKERKFYRVYAVLILMVLALFYIIMAAACGWQLNCSRRWNN